MRRTASSPRTPTAPGRASASWMTDLVPATDETEEWVDARRRPNTCPRNPRHPRWQRRRLRRSCVVASAALSTTVPLWASSSSATSAAFAAAFTGDRSPDAGIAFVFRRRLRRRLLCDPGRVGRARVVCHGCGPTRCSTRTTATTEATPEPATPGSAGSARGGPVPVWSIGPAERLRGRVCENHEAQRSREQPPGQAERRGSDGGAPRWPARLRRETRMQSYLDFVASPDCWK